MKLTTKPSGCRDESAGQQLSKGNALTEREIQIMDLVASGLENKEIADRMKLSSVSLAAKLIRRAFKKLGARRRAEAVSAWIRTRS